ncbi:PAS domain-containing protein [Haloarcula brevis]|uniref:PAS domain-containing protein n=1 Tax=Haloarcula brevis TaxID=3111453 RepID=UPI00300ED994
MGSQDSNDDSNRKTADDPQSDDYQQYVDFFENAGIPMHWVGPDGTILNANTAELEALGYSREEYVGHHIADFHADQDVIDDILERLRSGEEVREHEARMVSKDGSIRHVLITTSVNREDGAFVNTRCVMRDVTDRKEYKQELKQQNDRLEEIYGRISDAFFALDKNWQFTHLNNQAHEIINSDGRDLEGKHVWEEFPAATERKFKPKYERAMYNQETVSFEEYYPEPLDAWFEVRAYPSETGLSVYFRDITERKDRERKLEQTEARFQALAENFPNGGVHYFDEDLRYQYVAGGGFDDLDLSPEDLTGKTIYEVEVYPAEVVGRLESLMKSTLAGNEEAFEVTHENQIFELRSVPIRDGDGVIIGGFFIAHDITDKRRRERDLEHQNDQLEQFASIVSHDLRNPLSVAQGRLRLASAECDSEHLDSIEDALARSQTLIDHLLTLSREGNDVASIEPVNFSFTAENCWGNVETTEATLTVETERTIHADQSQLQQLLENLYRNAVEHGGDDVTVTVGDIENGFYVADDGPGIPEGNREQVFESGYSTSTKGTGYGLQIVTRICTGHGWDIRVTESDEGGARFEITGVEFAAE